MSYRDGRSWACQSGYNKHAGMMEGGELTDEEVDKDQAKVFSYHALDESPG